MSVIGVAMGGRPDIARKTKIDANDPKTWAGLATSCVLSPA